MAAYIEVVNSNINRRFTNAADCDLAITTDSNTQNIIIGTSNTPQAAFKLTSSNLQINSNIAFGGGLATKGLKLSHNTPNPTVSNQLITPPTTVSGIAPTGLSYYPFTLSNTQTGFTFQTSTNSNIFTINSNAIITTNMPGQILTGSTATALSNIVDATGTWTTLSRTGTQVVTAHNPNPLTSSNGSIDIFNGYFTFSNNNSIFAASNVAHSNIMSTDFYIESWVYYYSIPSQSSTFDFVANLIGNMQPTGGNNYWSFGLNRSMQLSAYFVANAGVGCAVYTQSNSIPLHSWTHIAVSYSNAAKSLSLYINGVAQSNLTACNQSGTLWILPSGSASTSASNIGITSLSVGTGSLVLGQYNNSNNPCYIHDFRMVTGTTYAPSNPPTVPATINTPGTRFLIQARPTFTQSKPVIATRNNGFLGVATSNPLTELDITGGSIRAGTLPFQTYVLTGTLAAQNNNTIVAYPTGVTRENIVDVWGLTTNTNGDLVPFEYLDATNWNVAYYLNVNNLILYPSGGASASKPYKVWLLVTQ